MSVRHEDPQFKFRIPAALKAKLEDAARTQNRTLTAEIIQRLEESFSSGHDLPRLKQLKGLDLGPLTAEETVLIAILRESDPSLKDAFMAFVRKAFFWRHERNPNEG